MTDIANDTPPVPATGEDREARTDAIQILARALWRERLIPTAEPADANAEGNDAAKAGRGDWKEKRRDYVKLATRLYKRLDRHGATLTAPARPADEDGEAA